MGAPNFSPTGLLNDVIEFCNYDFDFDFDGYFEVEPDFDRNYPVIKRWEKNIKIPSLEGENDVVLILDLRAGYYSGASFSLTAVIEDDGGYRWDDVEEFLEYFAEDEDEIGREIEDIISEEVSRLEKELKEKFCCLHCVAVASNGEAFYEKC